MLARCQWRMNGNVKLVVVIAIGTFAKMRNAERELKKGGKNKIEYNTHQTNCKIKKKMHIKWKPKDSERSSAVAAAARPTTGERTSFFCFAENQRKSFALQILLRFGSAVTFSLFHFNFFFFVAAAADVVVFFSHFCPRLLLLFHFHFMSFNIICLCNIIVVGGAEIVIGRQTVRPV